MLDTHLCFTDVFHRTEFNVIAYLGLFLLRMPKCILLPVGMTLFGIKVSRKLFSNTKRPEFRGEILESRASTGNIED